MTRYFLFQIISFKKYLYVSLGKLNIFYCYCGGPLVVEAPGQFAAQLAPALNPALVDNKFHSLRHDAI